MTSYHIRSPLAIATGLAATAGALAILLYEPWRTGAFALEHIMLPLLVCITIAAGHLVGAAARARHALHAAGFGAAFLLGTTMTIYSSVGSQSATTGNRAAGIEAHNRAIADKRDELRTARGRLTMAESMVDREAANKRCGQACADWKQRASEVRSHVAIIEAQIARMGAERVARPKAEAIGDLAAVLGFDRERVRVVAGALEPFAFSLLLEMTAIVAFGFGFGPATTRSGEAPPAGSRQAPLNSSFGTQATAAVTGGPPLAPRPGMSKAQTLDYLLTLQRVGQSLPTQAELTARTGRPKQTVSDWLREWERTGQIGARRAIGRTKQIA